MSTKYAKARTEAAQLKVSQRQMRDRMRCLQKQRNMLFDALFDLVKDLEMRAEYDKSGIVRAKKAIAEVQAYEPESVSA